MRYGVITIHRADNYGTALQAFATQRFIKMIGYDVCLIDYRCDEIEKNFGLYCLKNVSFSLSYIKKLIYNFLSIRSHSKFLRFYNEFYDLISFEQAEDEVFDVVCVGSDQVWNCNITGYDLTYFLDFQDDSVSKISFASSFGMYEDSIPRYYLSNGLSLLKSFDKISVRENKSRQIIEKYLNRNCEVIIDPTLLLSQKEWLSLIDNTKSAKKYILIYQIGYSDTIVKCAKEIRKMTGLKMYTIKGSILPKNLFHAKYIWDAGPLDFLRLFSGAEYIVTNSFHGTAFSINFHKKFFCEKLSTSDIGDTRIDDLLELTGLETRKIKDGVTQGGILETIDYERVEHILNNERKKARRYIDEIAGS